MSLNGAPMVRVAGGVRWGWGDRLPCEQMGTKNGYLSYDKGVYGVSGQV